MVDVTSIFDDHHPPSADLASDCVHCGFCLPKCPTYSLWGQEMDSPRGRIHLIKAGLAGEVEMDETFAGHFDSCLGCMSCVTACPSGVQYDQLLESVRPQIERLQPRTGTDRLFRAMIFALFPHPARLRVAALAGLAHQRLSRPLLRRLGLLDRLPARLRALEALLPPVRAGALFRRAPEFTPAQGERRASVALLTGCAQRVFFQDGVIPRTKLTPVLDRIAEMAREADLAVANVFHAGDGNLHPLVLYDARIPEQAERAEQLSTAIAELCVDAGGSLSGEHGIGTDKACSMPRMFSEIDLAAMDRVRAAFDPDGLCNPGKVLPTPRLCGERPGPYRPHPIETAGLAGRG